MKLRLDKNSIRLRLLKSDLEKLQKKHAIGETVLFPNGHFAYDLFINSDAEEVTAMLGDRSLKVTLPTLVAETWMNSDEVGIYHSSTFISDHSLQIIIEKDFPCSKTDEKANTDTFSELQSANLENPC